MGRKKKIEGKEPKFTMWVNPNYKEPEPPPMSEMDRQMLDLVSELKQYSKEELIELYTAMVRRDTTLVKLISIQNEFFKLHKKTDQSLLKIAEHLLQMPDCPDLESVLDCIDLLEALDIPPQDR